MALHFFKSVSKRWHPLSFFLLVCLGLCGCGSAPLKAYELTDPEQLNIAEILQTVALKTAAAYPDSFRLEKTTTWPELSQSEDWLVFQGEPFFELHFFSNPGADVGPTATILQIQDGRQHNLYLSREEEGWRLRESFTRDPIYEPADQAGAWCILNRLSADCWPIIEKYADDFQAEIQSDETGLQFSWKPADEAALKEAISADRSLHKLGCTLGTAFSESLNTQADGVLQGAVYTNAATEVTSAFRVEITVREDEHPSERKQLEELFAGPLKEGELLELNWLDVYFFS